MPTEPAWKAIMQRFKRVDAARLREDKPMKRRSSLSGIRRILDRAEQIRQESSGEHTNPR